MINAFSMCCSPHWHLCKYRHLKLCEQQLQPQTKPLLQTLCFLSLIPSNMMFVKTVHFEEKKKKKTLAWSRDYIIMIVSLRASSSQSAVISTTWLTQIHITHSYLMRYFGSLASWTWQRSDFMLVLIGLLNYAVSESGGSLSGWFRSISEHLWLG